MKQTLSLFILLLFHSLVFADKYEKVKIIMQDGSVLEGLATLPNNPSPTPINFKQNEKAKKQKLNCEDIKTLIYIFKDDKTLEFDRMDMYENTVTKTKQRVWLQVSKRGYTTLYTYDYIDIIGNISKSNSYWLCYRSGEEVATKISNTERKNKKDYFVQNAAEYFKDDPELVTKIEKGLFKWDNMETIVDEYNSWKESN